MGVSRARSWSRLPAFVNFWQEVPTFAKNLVKLTFEYPHEGPCVEPSTLSHSHDGFLSRNRLRLLTIRSKVDEFVPRMQHVDISTVLQPCHLMNSLATLSTYEYSSNLEHPHDGVFSCNRRRRLMCRSKVDEFVPRIQHVNL